MGASFYGDIWKNFWLDSSGREHDPEKVSQQVWAFIQKNGDLARMEKDQEAGQCAPAMRIVSLNPTVVLMIPCQHKRFVGTGQHLAHGTRSALELSFVPDKEMYFDEPMEWLSPDLRIGRTKVTFSDLGEAEIGLKKGKLKLKRDGEWCVVSRE